MSAPRADRPQMPGYGLASVSDGELLPWSWGVERLERSRVAFGFIEAAARFIRTATRWRFE